MILTSYFPELSSTQIQQFEQLHDRMLFWNEKINLISRKDTEHLWVRHILHSLMIAKVQRFLPDARILDVGTGGGFPGLPLSILFPETQFVLIDSITKKINVVQDIAQNIGLKNVNAQVTRAEQVTEKFDFIVSRAVTQLPDFYKWVKDKILPHSRHELKNGILYLKGGKLQSEIEKCGLPATLFALSYYSEEDFFDTKYVVYVPLCK